MVAVADRLDRYWAEELGCTTERLYSGGITTCAPMHRDGPRWMGWLVPLECIVLDQAEPGTGIISSSPRCYDELYRYVQSYAKACLPPHGKALDPFIRAHYPHGFAKVHRILQCDETTFAPAPDVFPISLLDTTDVHTSWYRMHFDGPVVVARNTKGHIASWAAIKCKSDDVWEMAVVTEARYRGMGLARSVVSHATMMALDAGKVPLYLHDVSNHSSAKVCRALGYQPYGYELTCECGRVTPRMAMEM